MRRCLSLTLLLGLSLPALADEPPKAEDGAAHHGRPTWQEHFAEANQAHDGHLTLEEAKGGYKLVAKHFDDIDADHKGYVTENDIRAWRVMRRAAHRLAQPPEDRLKPRPAMQIVPLEAKPLNTAATQTMVAPSQSASEPRAPAAE